ncbi:unnamed protein product [Boreogadus saida]
MEHYAEQRARRDATYAHGHRRSPAAPWSNLLERSTSTAGAAGRPSSCCSGSEGVEDGQRASWKPRTSRRRSERPAEARRCHGARRSPTSCSAAVHGWCPRQVLPHATDPAAAGPRAASPQTALRAGQQQPADGPS